MKTRKSWTDTEVTLLRLRYADTLTTDLAQQIGRPVQHVYAKAGRLGLRKGPQFIASSASGRILKGGRLSQATQFQTGHAPANKGLRRPGFAPGNMASTQFKPGSKPHTWVPVGSLRINPDGYLERKVHDEPGPNARRWMGVHRLVWEAVHGPTPPGHVVVFKPGCRSADAARITLDAVELISRRELMARNTFHALPPPLAQMVQLRGVLNRQINARSKKP